MTTCLSTIGLFGVFLFMTFYLQNVLGYSALRAGLAFLPMSGMIILGSTQISARLLNRVQARLLIGPGLLMAAGGLYILTFLDIHSSYVGHILPGTLLLGLGLGLVFVPAIATATSGVAPRDAGVTSATVNTAQQVGGSIGTALLNTIAATVTSTWLASHLPAAAAQHGGRLTEAQRRSLTNAGVTHGFTVAIAVAALIMLAAAVLAFLLINAKPGSRGSTPSRRRAPRGRRARWPTAPPDAHAAHAPRRGTCRAVHGTVARSPASTRPAPARRPAP